LDRSPAARAQQTAATDVPPDAHSMVFVCTANQCRSPIAEGLAAREATRRGLAIRTSSMGLLPGGTAVPALGQAMASELGLDLAGHLSRRLDLDELRHASLVLTMTRMHAREVLATVPGLWPRVFTVKQLASYALEHPPTAQSSLSVWLGEASHNRSRTELVGSDTSMDVLDPMGRSAETWRKVIAELVYNLNVIFDVCGSALAAPPSNPKHL